MSTPLAALVRSPIDAATPQGVALDEDDPDFALLETELMKRGGLSQGSIDWDQVEKAAHAILEGKSKHLFALSGLCGALARKGDVERLIEAIDGAVAFIETYWETAHPEGRRMGRRRAAMAEEIAQTLSRAAAPYARDSAEIRTRLGTAFEGMKAQWRGISVPTKALDDAIERLQTGPDSASPDGPRPAAPAAAPSANNAPAPAQGSGEGVGDPLAAMDTREIRRYREEIKAFADRIGALDPTATMPFRLRRYAAWLRQNQAPIADDTGKTGIQPMPGFVANEFAAALAHPDRGTLARLEDRLFTDPYWFEGHRLAALLATGCGLEGAARTILSVVAERVQRFPELETLLLTDGTPMIEDDARIWLAGARASETGGAGNAPWQTALADAQQEIEAANIGAALGVLDEGLDSAESDRDRAHWRLAFADLLTELELGRLAQEMYAGLLRDIDVPALQAWEPDLIRRVKKRIV